jgi:hypothetical protein
VEGKDAPSDGLRGAGYELTSDRNTAQMTYLHKASGIRVWADALDLSSPHLKKSSRRLGFHYTTRQGFANITNPGNRDNEVKVSLTKRSPHDCLYGDGSYTTQFDPQAFGCAEAVVYNNYRVFKPRHPGKVDAYLKNVEYCVPIITDKESFYEAKVRPTPEMQAPGIDKNGKSLWDMGHLKEHVSECPEARNKFAKVLEFGRDVVVIRVEEKGCIDNIRGSFEKVLRRRLDYRQGVHGPDHEKVAEACADLGEHLLAAGLLAEALKLFGNALRIRLLVFGKDHPTVGTTRNNIARVYQRQSKFAEALEEYTEALRVKIAAFGEDHPEVGRIRRNITRCHGKREGHDRGGGYR